LHYHSSAGSSRGVVEFLKTPKYQEDLGKWKEKNNYFEFKLEKSRRFSRHPYVQAFYLNGTERTMPLRNCEAREVIPQIDRLRQQINTQPKLMKHRVLTSKPSIQGQADLSIPITLKYPTPKYPEWAPRSPWINKLEK